MTKSLWTDDSFPEAAIVNEAPRLEPSSSKPGRAAQALGLVIWLAVCLGVGLTGSRATTPQLDGWYRGLQKPVWTPPDWIFGPVWTVLYVLMAVAAWLVWRQHGFAAARGPLLLFLTQLALNGAWSWIFFAAQQPGWGFVELVLLWLILLATTIQFCRRSRWAAKLLVPYLAWTTFAGCLNFEIWRLNAGG